MERFDIIVIGAGPAGQKAALQASKLRKSVALVEREREMGGACVTTGTLPSKTLRETVHYLSTLKGRIAEDVADVRIATNITMDQLIDRKSTVVRHETEIILDQLKRNNISIYRGSASFVDSHKIKVLAYNGMEIELEADRFVIATGSRPAEPRGIDFRHERFLDSDTLLELTEIPRTMTVLGGGVIGCEYACVFSTLGTQVNLVDRRDGLLRFMDLEVSDTLAFYMRENGVTIRQGEAVEAVGLASDGRLETKLKSGKIILSDYVLTAMGRSSNVDGMNLSELGIALNDSGLIEVDEQYRTAVEHIYAAGDVIGFPALASTSMEQGRLAALNAFGEEAQGFPEAFPYGLYTIPSISFAGRTEAELTQAGVPYEVGRAQFKESARAQIMGYEEGFIKLLFERDTLKLLGVHIIGESATELIHIGQAVMHFGGGIDYFVDNVFNYPTLAECYKMAALNGMNRL